MATKVNKRCNNEDDDGQVDTRHLEMSESEQMRLINKKISKWRLTVGLVSPVVMAGALTNITLGVQVITNALPILNVEYVPFVRRAGNLLVGCSYIQICAATVAIFAVCSKNSTSKIVAMFTSACAALFMGGLMGVAIHLLILCDTIDTEDFKDKASYPFGVTFCTSDLDQDCLTRYLNYMFIPTLVASLCILVAEGVMGVGIYKVVKTVWEKEKWIKDWRTRYDSRMAQEEEDNEADHSSDFEHHNFQDDDEPEDIDTDVEEETIDQKEAGHEDDEDKIYQADEYEHEHEQKVHFQIDEEQQKHLLEERRPDSEDEEEPHFTEQGEEETFQMDDLELDHDQEHGQLEKVEVHQHMD